MSSDITVIVPVHDGNRDYLYDCLLSLENQDIEVEVLIIDDGCGPETIKIMRQFDFRISRNAENCGQRYGVAYNLNIGLRKCRTKYFTWLSSDNIVTPECYQRLLEAIEGGQFVMAYGDFSSITLDGKNIYNSHDVPYLKHTTYSYEKLLQTCMVGVGFLMRTDTVRQIGGFNTEFFHAHDYDLWLRLGLMGELVKVNALLGAARTHQGREPQGQHPSGHQLSSQAEIDRAQRHARARLEHGWKGLILPLPGNQPIQDNHIHIDLIPIPTPKVL